MPNTTAEWKIISEKFESRWNIPNTIGALDGKHVHINHPRDAGSMFFNNKGSHSIFLMALVDADKKFT